MKMYDLIFSTDRSIRIKRHFLLWIIFYIYQVVRMSFLFPPEHLLEKLPLIFLTGLIWGVGHIMLISYTVVYYLVPKFYIKRKYAIFTFYIFLLFVLVFGFNILYNITIKQFTLAIGTTKEQPFIFIRGSLIRLFGNAPLVCGLLLSLKTLKSWHLKEKENEMLTRENANAEIGRAHV